jgi:hypothetical protein
MEEVAVEAPSQGFISHGISRSILSSPMARPRRLVHTARLFGWEHLRRRTGDIVAVDACVSWPQSPIRCPSSVSGLEELSVFDQRATAPRRRRSPLASGRGPAYLRLLPLSIALLLLAACSFAPGVAPGQARQAPSEAAPAGPVDPNVKAVVEFSRYNGDPRIGFLAYISHPYDYTLEGVTTRWEAYDQTDYLIESGTRVHPPIPAGTALPYIAEGRGSVGGRKESTRIRIDLRVVDSGRPSTAQLTTVPVTSVEHRKVTSSSSFSRGPSVSSNSTTITAKLRVDDPIAPNERIFVGFIARDGYDKIVAIGAAQTSNTDKITPGSILPMQVTGLKTVNPVWKAEAFAYVRAE